MSLVHTARKGLFWTTIDRFLRQGASFIIGIILARLIGPTEYGLIAMVTIFLALSQSLVEAGFSQALVQRKDLTESDCTTVLVANSVLSVLVFLVICIAAPHIAQFYQEPRLVTVIQCLALNLLLGAPAMVQGALMRKKMDFRSIAASAFPAQVISGIVGIVWAFCGFGVWALIIQALSNTALGSLFLWRASDWRPCAPFSVESIKALCPYGLRMAASGFLASLTNNLNTLVIGKFYPAAEVAFYQRAAGLQQLPTNNLILITTPISFSLLSSIQDDIPRLRRSLQKMIRLQAFINFPGMVLLAIIAHDLIFVLIGSEWLPAAKYLQLLCIVGALWPLSRVHSMLLSSMGHAKIYLRTDILKKTLRVGLLFLTFRWGVYALIAGQVVAYAIALCIDTYYTRKFIGYGFLSQFRDTFPCILLSGVAFVFVFYLQPYLSTLPIVRVVVVAVLFAIPYVSLSVLMKLPALKDFVTLIKRDKAAVAV